MEHLFGPGLSISFTAGLGSLQVQISADFSGSNRKSQLYVSEDRIAEEVKKMWKSFKTRLITKMSVSFEEIDWYDDMTDIYTTPYVFIKRGLKIPRISENEHGSIPKDWSIVVTGNFKKTSQSTPVMEFLNKVAGTKRIKQNEKEILKALKKILKEESSYSSVREPEEED